MAFVTFPEPPELKVRYEDMITDGKSISVSPYSVETPHPGFGKDPNIANELGHTKYPMYVGNVIVNNEEEEKAARNGEEAKPSVPQTTGWGVVKATLREDGPTVAEYVAAGYPASSYPPAGFASKSSKEEIEAAIAAASSGWGKQ